MPIFIKPNSDGRTFKMYKVDFQNTSNCYTYWFGVDEYYSDSPINAHTISQIVREDKNLNEKTFPGHNARKYFADWELFQVSPSTLALYKALYKAKSYVFKEDALTRYFPEQYLEFLRYTTSAMAEYNKNRGTFNDSATDPGRIKMDQIAGNLNTLMTRLDAPVAQTERSYSELRNAISGVGWPYGERHTSLPSSMEGHWLILGGESRGVANTLYGVNPDVRGSWNDAATPVANGHRGVDTMPVTYYIANGTDWGTASPPYTTILKLSGSSSSFTVQIYNGQYWNLNRNSNGSSTWANVDFGSSINLTVTAADSGRFMYIPLLKMPILSQTAILFEQNMPTIVLRRTNIIFSKSMKNFSTSAML
jgi:hypothetical protein